MSKHLAIECDVETGQQVVYVPQGYTLQRNYVGAYVLTPDAAPATEPEAPTYERWEPKDGELFYYISEGGHVLESTSYDRAREKDYLDFGVFFPGELTAQRARNWIRANLRLRELARMMNEGKETKSYTFYIYRNHGGVVNVGSLAAAYMPSGITAFTTEEDATRAIEIMTAEGLLDDLFLAP
jgi:hypothetical protein